MNINAMKTTRDEYMDNLKAVKGEKYATFIDDTICVLSGIEVIMQGTSPEFQETTKFVLMRLCDKTIRLLAEHAGIDKEDIGAALNEAETMKTAVEKACDLDESVV